MIPARIFIAIAFLISCIATTALAWTPNAQEVAIADRMKNASGQRRAFLQFDPILAQVARERAMDLAKRRYFDHINPDGHGANYLVREAGYVLPDWYPADGNNLESLAAGGATADVTWSDWMGSSGHKTHVLGENTFFADQTSYGVGYYADSGSPYRHYWVVLTAPPMARPATISILSPTADAAVPEGIVNASGKTAGAQAAASVQIAIQNASGTSAWTTVGGTQNWSGTLRNLVPGANTLRVRSRDSGGAVLAEASRNFQYVVIRPLTIGVEGQGTVAGFAGTTSRRVGVTYTIVAKPAAGWVFSGWSGGWSGSQATTKFVMREGLAATATFIPNPFLTWRGSYGGLIGASATDRSARGVVRAQVDGLGNLTGRLLLAGKSHVLRGKFRLNGTATLRVAREGALPLILELNLNGAGGGITGTLTDDTTTHDLNIARARQTGAALAAFAGRYTVVFPAPLSDGGSTTPRGDGYGVLVVDKTGVGRLTGVLADGAALVTAGWIAENGTFTIYQPLYSGRGELSGALTFTDTPESDVAGTLFWQRPQSPPTARFPQGFSTTVAAAGARYTPPGTGRPAIVVPEGNPNAQLVFSAGGFANEVVQPAQVVATNRLLIANPLIPKVTAVANPEKGFFVGTFTHPASGAATRFRGVILQKQNSGSGFFLGVGQSGGVSLAPAR